MGRLVESSVEADITYCWNVVFVQFLARIGPWEPEYWSLIEVECRHTRNPANDGLEKRKNIDRC
jgi:hypothetical protein